MTLFNTLPLSDGTEGFRFDVTITKGLYRKRLTKRRWGITKGETMRAVHFGKRSVYFQLVEPQRRLYDFALLKWVNAYQLVFKVKGS